ncbi:M20/M25/M40 family metallo-hydrolase [Spirochaeta cellobiosiphila]|uniref:M20/M25/M40 family metallo-hydrolase n=1 Tax=Spirochaeta cellobiosiphila TaxID=504483 RepID=UPI00041BC55A|nr:M20/M25/M40 family metallo-hydrolase [Spirochaeta cellobiosiphila]
MREDVSLLQELIRNKCVNTGDVKSGNEIISCHTLERFFNTYGYEGEILHKEESRSNYLLRVPGYDKKAPSLMFQCHLDVVPATEEDWDLPPFEGIIQDDVLWGRGAVDMLNITAAMAVGFVKALKQKTSFPGDLIFLALADEEASGQYGADFLTKHHWDKVQCDYQISELGGFHLATDNGPALTLARGEKGVMWTRISVKGTASHGSMPYKSDNAAYKIAKVLQLLADQNTAPKLHDLFKDMVAQSLTSSIAARLLNFEDHDLGLDQVFEDNPGWAKFLHSASHLSISPGVIRIGDKVNIVPDRGVLDLDIRILPGENKDSALAELRRILEPCLNDIDIEVFEYFPPNLSKKDTPLKKAITQVTSGHFPKHQILDMLIGGVTDGRYWRNKGTCVYGFSLFDEELTLNAYSERLHGKNERISLNSLKLSTDFFTEIPSSFYREWELSK